MIKKKANSVNNSQAIRKWSPFEHTNKVPRQSSSALQQQRPVANHVGLDDQADTGDDHHVGEGERQPEVLLRVGRAGEAADPVAEIGDHVQDSAGDGDEEDAHHGEAEGEQAQAEDDESLGGGPLHRRHSNWLSGQEVAA